MKAQIALAPSVMVNHATGAPVSIAIKHVMCVVRGAGRIYEFDLGRGEMNESLTPALP